MTGGGTPTKDHHHLYLHHHHHHLYQNHHNHHYNLFTQGDYVGSVHQSGGCFRTASSPICGKKKNILFFTSFLLIFFHAGSPICDKKMISIFTFLLLHFFIHVACWSCNATVPSVWNIFHISFFHAKCCLQFFVERVQYIISKKMIWFWFNFDLIKMCLLWSEPFIFSILTIESRGFWIRCFLLLFTQSILELAQEGQG